MSKLAGECDDNGAGSIPQRLFGDGEKRGNAIAHTLAKLGAMEDLDCVWVEEVTGSIAIFFLWNFFSDDA